MVSEVNGSKASAVVTPLEHRAPKVDRAADGMQPATQAGGELVKLTDLASTLRSLMESVADVPEVDRARVSALREAIADGSYQPDARAVAEKLVGFESMLSDAARTE